MDRGNLGLEQSEERQWPWKIEGLILGWDGIVEGSTLQSYGILFLIHLTNSWCIQGSAVSKTKSHSEIQSTKQEEDKASKANTKTKTRANSGVEARWFVKGYRPVESQS